jgi:hemerythrin superfamily protein
MDREGHRNTGDGGGQTTRRNPKGYVRSDERIFEDICEALIRDRDIDTSLLRVTVKDGVVSLQGRVPSRRDKYRVEQITEGARGVRDVENHLRVSSEGFDSELHPELRQGIFATLTREHRTVSVMFEQILSGRGEPAGRAEKFATLARDLLSHAHAEQEVLYTALAPRMPAEVRKAREEHALVERVVEDVMARGRADETWLAKVEVLKELVEHHVQEEEGRFFLEALRALDPQQSDALDAQYAQARDRQRALLDERRARPAAREPAASSATVSNKDSSAGAAPAEARPRASSERGRTARK